MVGSVRGCTSKERKEADWIEEFNFLIKDSTRLRLRSDVPFGAFLSGGIDSSTIVGLMSEINDSPIKTFSIGFSNPKYDETEFAIYASKDLALNMNIRLLSLTC